LQLEGQAGERVEPLNEGERCLEASEEAPRRDRSGTAGGPRVTRTTFEDLMAMLKDDYKANGRKSAFKLQTTIDHLAVVFATDKAQDITTDRTTKYVAYRQDEKAAPATINLELMRLSRGFTLALRAGKVASKPHIPMLKVQNTRKGFFELEDFK